MDPSPYRPSINGEKVSQLWLASLTLSAATLLGFAAQADLLPAVILPPVWRSLVLLSPVTGLFSMSVGSQERRREWRSDRYGTLAWVGGALVLAFGLVMWAGFAFAWLFA